LLPRSKNKDSIIFISTEGKGSRFVPDKHFHKGLANAELRKTRRNANLSDNITFEGIRQAGLRRFVRLGGTLTDARNYYGCKSLDTIEDIIDPD